MKNAGKFLTVLLVSLMIIALLPVLSFAGDDNEPGGQLERLWGENRWETSKEVALAAYPEGADQVIIARGDGPGDDPNVVDGLAGGYLAGVLDAPILITEQDQLPGAVEEAIEELGAMKAYILGGTAAVTEAVEDELEGLGLETERIEGVDRYDTAAQIAHQKDNPVGSAFIVNGWALADSMVAGAAAFDKGYPILLVSYDDEIDDATEDAITELGIGNLIIVGGEAVVSEGAAEALEALDGVEDVRRHWGPGREETSEDFAHNEFPGATDFSIVNGRTGLADAVGASVFGKPILYVQAELVPPVISYILNNSVTGESMLQIFGGNMVVSDSVANSLGQILDDPVTYARVSGTAKDARTGDPLQGANINFWNLEGEFDADVVQSDGKGYFSAHVPIEPGKNSYHIWFDYEGYTDPFAIEKEIVEDTNLGEVDFYPPDMAGTIKGTVTDKDTGETLEEFHIFAELNDTPYIFMYDTDHVYTEGPGNYEMFVAEGDYSIRVSAHGYYDYHEQVNVEAEEITTLDLPLEALEKVDPHFTVDPRHNNMWGHDWPETTELDVIIGDPDNPDWGGNVQTDEGGYFPLFGEIDYNIEFGDQVIVTDGTITRAHQVELLRIVEIDYENDIVYGDAEANRENIDVAIWQGPDADEHPRKYVDADEQGKWEADFSEIGEDVDLGDEIHVHVRDNEENATFAGGSWMISRIWVNPVKNSLHLRAWLPDQGFVIDFNGEKEETIVTDPWGDRGFLVDEEFYDIQAGDTITVTQDDIIESHTVTDLTLTEVDEEANTVSGTAEPGSEVRADILIGDHYDEEQRVTVDEQGDWSVEFTEIEPDSEGTVWQVDDEAEVGNLTWLSWPDDLPGSVGSVEIAEPLEGSTLSGDEQITIMVEDNTGDPFMGTADIELTFVFDDATEESGTPPEPIDFSEDPEGEHTTHPTIEEHIEESGKDVADIASIAVEVEGVTDRINVNP